LFIGSIVIALGLTACAATRPSTSPPRQAVEFDAFSVEAPPGEGWAMEKGVDEVSFVRVYGVLWVLTGHTRVRVFRKRAAPEDRRRPVNAMAEEFLAASLENLGRGAAGFDELSDVVHGKAVVDGRSLYSLQYHMSSAAELEKPVWLCQEILFLYFPEDFAMHGAFYGFLLSEVSQLGFGRGPADVSNLEAVVRSFRHKEPRIAPEATPLFEEEESLGEAAELAVEWSRRHLSASE
jgi:hypothetical protein